ncbi:MAG TPA: fibronectin type III domain-containing protein, partial [Anaerolinea sp.]|nr:fibronectin type III domain-containing protein [Anaerolinea sp.]
MEKTGSLSTRGAQAQTVSVPVAGYLPEGVKLAGVYGVNNAGKVNVSVTGGSLTVTLNPMSAWLLVAAKTDLKPTAAPTGLVVTNEGNGQLDLAWNAVNGAAGYNLYRSPLSGGGWVKVNAALLNGTTFTDSGLSNGQTYYYVATAIDQPGNESAFSNEASGLPHYQIGWANLQWPPTLTHTISIVNRTDTVYGQVWIDGVTNKPGATPTLRAQLGFGPSDSDPASAAG